MSFFRPLESVVRDYIDWATDDHPRVGFGYPIMDSRTSGGAAHGEVILFQARSQVGKTAIAVNCVDKNCPRPTVFFSLEMAGRYIAMRMAAVHSDYPTANIEWELRTQGRSDPLQRLVNDFPELAIIDKPAMSLKHMSESIHEVQQKWGKPVDLVVIDYMELIGGVPSLSAVEKIDQVGRKVKDMAREHDCVILLLHQVGRGEGGAGADPLNIASARYGGETAADYVMAAYRSCLRKGITQEEYLAERWAVHLQFLKTRGGSEIHPEGLIHKLNPFSMRISYPYESRPEPLFAVDAEPMELEVV